MRALSTVAILTATLGWLCALFALRPFDHINNGMDSAFGAMPAWTQIENSGMHRDPEIQEASHGSRPLESFRILAKTWAATPQAVRIVLMGNSQTYMTSLAPGEPRPSGLEKAYPDLMAEAYRDAGSRKVIYQLAAGALSYEEMLWYANYLVLKPDIRPRVLLVQLNYQNLVNSGIRDGMLELLTDAEFRRAAERIAGSGRADGNSFGLALQHYDEEQSRLKAPPSTAQTPPPTAGYQFESRVREQLDRIPGFDGRPALKASFVYMLLRFRTYFLHVGSATRRSLTGIRVDASRAALEDLAEVCRRAGIRMVLFQAPTNPAVPLYRTEEDDRSYHGFATSLAARYGLTLLDFEHSIPQGHWGMTLNVPDPLHLSREGHRSMAQSMMAALEEHGI